MQVHTWETETYPAIRTEAQVGATILWRRSGIRSDYHRHDPGRHGRQWCRRRAGASR